MIRAGLWFLLAIGVVLGLANCVPNGAGIPGRNVEKQVMVPIASLPNPKLPDWILQISPTGEADTLTQVRIRFREPLIPLEQLESQEQQSILSKFQITPALPGEFRFLTPRMVGFQATQALPLSSRIQVTLKAGLADLQAHQLDQDLAWTFTTPAIALSNFPGKLVSGFSEEDYGDDSPVDISPSFTIAANVELNLADLRNRLKLVPLVPGNSEVAVPLSVVLHKDDTANPGAVFDESERSWQYDITPRRNLEKGTTYRLEVLSGLQAAKGNLSSDKTFASEFSTYHPLKFTALGYVEQPGADPTYGRFSKGAAELQFNNPLDAASVADAITIAPAPRPDIPLLQAYDGTDAVKLNPYALEPNTTYTITIGKTLKDSFGQTLEQEVTVSYQTGDIAPDLWTPSGLNIFPTSKKDLQLNIVGVNLPDGGYRAAYRTVQPADLVYVDTSWTIDSAKTLLPEPADWRSFPLKAEKNRTGSVTVNLQQQLGGRTGMLAYGVRARTNSYKDKEQQKWREGSYYGMVQVTNLGVFAQWFPQSGLVRVSHLSDGNAVANAVVELYESKPEAKERPQPVPCATGKTDRQGILTLEQAALKTCMKGKTSFESAPSLLVVAREGQDWAFTRTDEYSGAYGYGIYTDWQGTSPIAKGALFSDRQLYQPGETAYITGLAYYLKDGKLQRDANTSYSIRLEAPDGKSTALGKQTTTRFGTFSVEVPLAAMQPLGFYTITARSPQGVELRGDFRVAEFKPPNFKVDLALSGGVAASSAVQATSPEGNAELAEPVAMIATVGQKIQAEVNSSYLFGAPVEGGKVNYYITRQRTNFTPAGWQSFTFGQQWYWPQEAPEIPTDVLQAEQALDRKGRNQQQVPVTEIPYPMIYRVDAQVSDVSNLTVAASQSFIALPVDRLIGIQSEFVGEANKPLRVQTIVTDPNGQQIVGERVRLELQSMTYSDITRIVEGSRTQQTQVEFKTVATADITSGETAQTATLTPPKAGSYRIRATFANVRSNDLSATDSQVWVAGTETAFWGDRYDNNRLDVKLDKTRYKLGDTATAVIQSPYAEAELHLAVIRHKVLYQTIVPVKGSAPTVQFTITPDMLPNAAVEAVLVRRGQPLEQVPDGSLKNLLKVGFTPFQTDLRDRYLQVAIQANPSLKPGEQQTVQLALTDAAGKPMQGQITVMVVNDAVLQLTGYRPPDPVAMVYAPQDIATRFADNRPDVILAKIPSPLDKGWGYGGGFSRGLGGTRLRSDFKPIAYYNGAVTTDANGKASVTFPLPDNLTTWRVMAVAVSDRACTVSSTASNQCLGSARNPSSPDPQPLLGTGEMTFITTQPLVANPVLPQFARPGDRFQVGIALTNTTGNRGNAAITAEVQNGLTFEAQDPAAPQSTSLQVAETGTQVKQFSVVATAPGESKLRFTTTLNDTGDAVEATLPVRDLAVTEQAVESGTTERSLKFPLKVDKTVDPNTGGLELSLASSLIPQLTAPAQQLLAEEPLPLLEVAASRLAIAASLQTLSKTYSKAMDRLQPTKEATQQLEQLQALQREDGGFAFYSGAEGSDPVVTPYAASAIAMARNAGIAMDNTMVTRLTTYLETLLTNPGQDESCNDARCQNRRRLAALVALADLGDPRTDFLKGLYQARASFTSLEQVRLARYLSRFPAWQSQATAMAAEFQKTFSETASAATVTPSADNWWWLSSPTAAQAEVVKLAIAQNADQSTLARLVQGLLNQQRQGTWQTTYDTAQALTALVAYTQLQPTPPSFSIAATLAGKPVANAQFQGYQTPSLQTTIPMAELPRGNHDLVLDKSGRGTLYYRVAFRYRLQGDAPGRLNGLRVRREVRPANQETPIASYGLAALTAPVAVEAGQVYDVGLQLITDHTVHHVVITDPLPAGFEAVDTSFQTSTPYFQASGDSWQVGYQDIYRDRVVAYADRLEAGVYTLHYLVRSITQGTFLWPGTEAHLRYNPEEFGRTTTSTLVVR